MPRKNARPAEKKRRAKLKAKAARKPRRRSVLFDEAHPSGLVMGVATAAMAARLLNRS